MTSTPPALETERTTLPQAVARALSTVERNIGAFDRGFPDDTTRDGRYAARPASGHIPLGGNHGWTTTFWTGVRWLAWELSGDDRFRTAALRDSADFARRVHAGDDLDTHDLGFLYSLSTVPAWRLLADDDARSASLLAAEHLMGRFLEPAGIIQAWGALEDARQRGRTIIDSLMNMPLLSWAGEQTGEARYAEAVIRHTSQLREHIMRPDDSTFHTFYWDVETGAPLRGATEQGAGDDSCWARGQAWGVYGFALNARATGDDKMRDAARRCAAYFVDHLPSDRVPFWDLSCSEGSRAPRDSSAAAIAVCGLLELAELEPDPEWARWATGSATRILASLVDHYAPAEGESDALLLHGVYDLPKQRGVDEGTLWGDYFYLEALARVTLPGWRPYW